MIIYLDQGNYTYYGLCLAAASDKVRFQFATFSFVSVAEKEREKQFEAALIKSERLACCYYQPNCHEANWALLSCSGQRWAVSQPEASVAFKELLHKVRGFSCRPAEVTLVNWLAESSTSQREGPYSA